MSRCLRSRALLAAVVPTLLIASSPVLAATQASSAALASVPVQNPGAEADASSWTGINATVSRSTTSVRTGAGSFALQTTAAGHAALISTSPLAGLVPGQLLQVSAWVRSASVPRNAVLQADWRNDVGYVGTSSTAQVVTSTSGWTQLIGTITPAAGADRLQLYVKFIDAGSGEVHYVDDFTVESPQDVPAPVTPVLTALSNPGAEVDAGGWTGVNATLTRTTTPVQNGTGSFRVRATASGSAGMTARDDVRGVVPGQTLTASAWVRSANIGRVVQIRADWRSSSGSVGTSTGQATTSTAGWTQVSGTFTAPAGADRVRIHVTFSRALRGEVHFVDEVRVAPAAVPPPAPTTGPTTPPTSTPTTPPTSTSPRPAPSLPTTLALTWADEFDGGVLDSTKWSTKEPWHSSPGFANDSEAWLPAPATATNLAVVDGALSLKARREALAVSNGKVMTTAMLTSRGKYDQFTHGVIEARLKLPTGKGLWPAFWLVGNGTGATGWPSTGEVDIFEYVNNASGGAGRMYSSVHWGDIVNGSIASHYAASKSVASPWWGDGQFHTFTLHRTANFLRFFIDGVQVMQLVPGESVPGYSTPVPSGGALFDDPMHVRLSLEVGGPWAGQGYTPSQYEPGDLVVDYVRSWK